MGEQHKLTLDLKKKSELGAIPYQQSVIRDTPIGRGIKVDPLEKNVKNRKESRRVFLRAIISDIKILH